MQIIIKSLAVFCLLICGAYSADPSANISKKISDQISKIISGDGYTETSVDLRENNSPDFSILAVRELEKYDNGNFFTQFSLFSTEQNHDDKGIIFPMSIAPFHIHLVSLNTEKEDVVRQSDALYNELTQNGHQVLYDDRTESPGVKLNDADLLGLPIRIITSSRNLNKDCVEVKLRNEKDSKALPIKDISVTIESILQTTG